MSNYTAVALAAAFLIATGCSHSTAKPEGRPPQSPPPSVESRAITERPLQAQSSDVQMVGSTQGWALAGYRVLRLVDSGRRWAEVSPPELVVMDAERGRMRATADFRNATTAWLAVSQRDGGSPGVTIYHTENGGQTWRRVAAMPGAGSRAGHYPRSISFPDDRNGWVMVHPDDTMGSNPGDLFNTTDGGATWTLVATVGSDGDGKLPFGGQVRFVDGATGWMVGNKAATLPGTLHVTRDGGRTWAPVILPMPEGLPSGKLDFARLPTFSGTGLQDAGLEVTFVPDDHMADGHRTIRYRTSDGGRGWQSDSPVRPQDTGKSPAAAELPVEAMSVRPTATVSIALAGAEWRMELPAGSTPLTAADERGILWVSYPPLVGREESVRPAGDYVVLYTPLRPAGGDLAEGARKLLTLPGSNSGRDLRVLQVAQVASGHFLVYTHTQFPGAQTGGTVQVWWIEPQSGRAAVIVSAPAGGGNYQSLVKNDRFLFWNQSRANAPSFQPLVKDARAVLVDLNTGESREVQLGGNNWALEAEWREDGRLHFKLEGDDRWHVLDPAAALAEAAFLDVRTDWVVLHTTSPGTLESTPVASATAFTDDGGKSWSELGRIDFVLTRLAFVSKTRGWAAASWLRPPMAGAHGWSGGRDSSRPRTLMSPLPPHTPQARPGVSA